MMSQPYKTTRSTAEVVVGGVSLGEHPSITVIYDTVGRGGASRRFVRQLSIADPSLFRRLKADVSQGDNIEVTVTTDWYDTGSITVLEDFNKRLKESQSVRGFSTTGTPVTTQKWSKGTVRLEIISRYEAGENLNYSSVAVNNLSLLRAAIRYFGTWENAVRFAGLDYDSIRRHKSWTQEKIIARIKDLYAQGIDLSWRNVRLNVDPQLAAATTKKNHFGSWRKALEASGLNYDDIRKYREWDDERILQMVREFHGSGKDLAEENVEREDLSLITAARHRFDSWHKALTAAGLDYTEIVHRTPYKRSMGRAK